jgi:hypothetical protein
LDHATELLFPKRTTQLPEGSEKLAFEPAGALSSGYVMPGTSPGAGQTALPSDLEQAAVEQVAYWFQNRDKLGPLRHWPHQYFYLDQSPVEVHLERVILSSHVHYRDRQKQPARLDRR